MHFLYSFSLKLGIIFAGVLILLLFMTVKSTYAASLSSASATLTTSRPSPSSPLSANAAAGAGQISVFDNASRYLASDSAKVIRASGGVITNTELIASQSGALTTVYLADTLGTAAGAGADVLFVPITSMHSISFTLATTVPSGGDIVISYPGAANNTASPSATTFAFNNLQTTQVVSEPAAACNTVSVSSPSVTCTTNAIVAAGTRVTVLLGCTAQTSGSCTAQVPRLINPTKNSQTAGAADIWKIGILTRDAADVTLDNSTVSIGTVESVTVRATIDPTLTFTITGVTSGAVNTGNSTGCGQTENVNSGISATATEVGLGVLSVAPAVDIQIRNIAAQLLTVTTNGANGYSITATSSGHLRSPSTGFFLNDSLSPATFPASGHYFGLHACGRDADRESTRWTTVAADSNCATEITGSGGTLCKYGWPTETSPIVIAQDTSGPVGNTVVAGNGLTSVSYAATQDVTLPPGEYQTVVTYVATPSF